MTIKEMMMSDIEERMAAIKTEMENRDADLDALTEEVRQLKERRAELEAQAEKRRKLEDDVRENGVTTRNLKDLGGTSETICRDRKNKYQIRRSPFRPGKRREAGNADAGKRNQ